MLSRISLFIKYWCLNNYIVWEENMRSVTPAIFFEYTIANLNFY